MRVSLSGLKQDNPALPLLRAQLSYQGITSGAGNAFGTTLVDNLCSTAGLQPGYVGQALKLLSSDASGQVRPIAVHDLATGILTVAAAFTDFNGVVYQIPAGTQFVILSSAGGGAPAPVLAPSIGLWMLGECDPAMAASTTAIVCPNLAGFPDNIFDDEFWMQVIHNDDVPGTAPEREWRRITNYVGATGVFTTDAFSANVEANDLVAIVHESITGIEILGFGTLTTSSATVPADNTRLAAYAWENDDYFNGCLLMPTEGDCRFQPRRIVDYVSATGVFTLDPNNPFSQLPGEVDYIIVRSQTEFIPAVDGANNRTPADVAGGKADTAITTPDDVSSAQRYLKGILDAVAGTTGARVMGKSQIAATTIDLDQGIGSFDLFTGTAQVVILESLNIKMPTGALGGTLSSISIQTDDATPGVIISAADGAVANLTTEADLGWTGTLYITVATKIQLSILGGPSVADYICNVIAKYRAVVSGGYLA